MPRRSNATGRAQVQPVRIGDLFTDRLAESTAFAESLQAHRQYMDAEFEEHHARNCLVFYGASGVGKTTLSERLEAWIGSDPSGTEQWGPPPPTAVAATARIDLHSSQGRFSMFDALVRIRYAFGRVRRKWPAFDLAFYTYWSSYWSATHPNQELPQNSWGTGEFAEGAKDVVTEALALAGIPGGAIAVRSLRLLAREFKSRKQLRYLSGNYEGYGDLLRNCADLPNADNEHPELLAELASLLDFELSNLDSAASMVVVFIDSFERLTLDPRRTGERSCNHLIWSMPNVLFVITGQQSLDWYEIKRSNLVAAGPALWPNLIPGNTIEPRQHRLEKLDMVDRERIIALGRDRLGLDISDEVMHELAEASGGLPVYLSLAIEIARKKLLNRAGAVTVDDVTGSLDDLLGRVLEGIPEDERRGLQAAAIFPYFDVELIAEVGLVDHGCARRAVTRPMIDQRGSSFFSYSMHDEIRRALRAVGERLPGGWAPADWTRSATRAVAELRIRYENALDLEHNARALETLGLAVSLVCEFDVEVGAASQDSEYDDWLCQAIIHGPSITGLRRHIPVVSGTGYGRAILDLVTARTGELTADDSAEILERIFRSSHPLRFAAGRHRGYIFRNAGRWEDAIAAFGEVVEAAPTEMHLYQRALTVAIARRFREAEALAAGISEKRRQQIIVGCQAMQGSFDEWFPIQEDRMEFLIKRNRRREVIEFTGDILQWRALLGLDVSSQEVDSLLDESERVSHPTGMRDGLLTKTLLRQDGADEIAAAVDRLETLDRAYNRGQMGYRTALAKASVAYNANDDAALAELASQLCTLGRPRGRRWIPIECLLRSVGFHVDEQPTEWTTPYADVERHWQMIFSAWRTRHN